MAGRLWGVVLLTAALSGLLFRAKARAEETVYESPPPPEPGFQIVEEVRYKAVPCGKHVCAVSDTKRFTKTVYDVKCIDFAYKKCPGCGYEYRCCSGCDGGGNPDCVNCGKVRTRKVLLKKFETEECPTTRCDVQCEYEQVPYKVYRKVPIGSKSELAPPPIEKTEPLPEPIERREKESMKVD